jgi:hypothetical protein
MAICEASTRTYRRGMQVETTAVNYGQTVSGIRVVMNTGDAVLVNREGKNTLFRIVGTAGQIEFWGSVFAVVYSLEKLELMMNVKRDAREVPDPEVRVTPRCRARRQIGNQY